MTTTSLESALEAPIVDPDPFFRGVADYCKRIRTMTKEFASIESLDNLYVIPGRNIILKTTADERYSIWCGRNQHRLFFITNIQFPSTHDASAEFAFCFGGAEQSGWRVNYQNYNSNTSIWATADTDPEKPLIADGKLTSWGEFWAADIAMMTQSFIRTAERGDIRCVPELPAPL